MEANRLASSFCRRTRYDDLLDQFAARGIGFFDNTYRNIGMYKPHSATDIDAHGIGNDYSLRRQDAADRLLLFFSLPNPRVKTTRLVKILSVETDIKSSYNYSGKNGLKNKLPPLQKR